MQKQGKIIGQVNPFLKPHEWDTINFLIYFGYNIEIIPECRIKGVHTPDIRIDAIEWEIKSPRANTNCIIKNTLRDAAKQSSNIIIDLRRTCRRDEQCMHEIKKWFTGHNKVKNIWIITKKLELIKL